MGDFKKLCICQVQTVNVKFFWHFNHNSIEQKNTPYGEKS